MQTNAGYTLQPPTRWARGAHGVLDKPKLTVYEVHAAHVQQRTAVKGKAGRTPQAEAHNEIKVRTGGTYHVRYTYESTRLTPHMREHTLRYRLARAELVLKFQSYCNSTFNAIGS